MTFKLTLSPLWFFQWTDGNLIETFINEEWGGENNLNLSKIWQKFKILSDVILKLLNVYWTFELHLSVPADQQVRPHSNKLRVKSTRENDKFACEIHTHACRFLNLFLLRHAQFFRTHARVWFQHARVWFQHA
jgi:hypothetical protein